MQPLGHAALFRTLASPAAGGWGVRRAGVVTQVAAFSRAVADAPNRRPVTPLMSRDRYGGRVKSPEMTDQDLLTSWELITRAVTRTQERVLARIEEAGLPSQWFAALHLLLRSSDHRMPMSRLARELSMTSGGFTKLADRMGQDGLIDRRNSAGDRRVVYAALTDDGLRMARRTERQYRASLREHVLDVLTAAELAVLAACARTLVEAEGDSAHDVGHPEVAPVRDPALPERRARGSRRAGSAEGAQSATGGDPAARIRARRDRSHVSTRRQVRRMMLF